tara:strand:- start:6207 stop:7079 length:873 start_codon:yes stop_codon:yes gene_type:complete
MTNINSLFDSIKDSMEKSTGQSNRGQFLKTEVGNTYTVRLIPNVTDGAKTFFHYYTHGWTSFATGQYINQISPQTWGERDPIGEARYRLSKNGTAEEKEKASTILRRENWMVNVYVVNDPVNPDNNGTVKLLRFGRQLHKVIMEAMQGEEAEDFGPRIFDVENGCDFRIKVEKQGDFPTYVSSKFGLPKPLKTDYDGGVDGIHKSAHDLEAVFTVKSYDELKELLNEHFFCVSNDEEVSTATATAAVAAASTAAVVETTTSTATEPAKEEATETSEQDIDDLLASLDNMS